MRAGGTSSTIIITWNLHSLSFREQPALELSDFSLILCVCILAISEFIKGLYHCKWFSGCIVYLPTFGQALWFGFVLLFQIHASILHYDRVSNGENWVTYCFWFGAWHCLCLDVFKHTRRFEEIIAIVLVVYWIKLMCWWNDGCASFT